MQFRAKFLKAHAVDVHAKHIVAYDKLGWLQPELQNLPLDPQKTGPPVLDELHVLKRLRMALLRISDCPANASLSNSPRLSPPGELTSSLSSYDHDFLDICTGWYVDGTLLEGV